MVKGEWNRKGLFAVIDDKEIFCEAHNSDGPRCWRHARGSLAQRDGQRDARRDQDLRMLPWAGDNGTTSSTPRINGQPSVYVVKPLRELSALERSAGLLPISNRPSSSMLRSGQMRVKLFSQESDGAGKRIGAVVGVQPGSKAMTRPRIDYQVGSAA
jgi:hypothetical protein